MENTQDIFNGKMMESYNMVFENGEPVELLTGLLFSVHEYSYAELESNRVNHRQNKNRRSYSSESTSMTSYVTEDEDRELTELLVEKLNIYLSTKLELPKSKITQQGFLNQTKALSIMLINNKLYEVFSRLEFPEYVKRYNDDIFKEIEINQGDILDKFIEYLNDSGNEFLIEIVSSKRLDFWGSFNVDPINVFELHFGSYKKEDFNDYDNVLKVFTHYCNEYRKSSKGVQINKLIGLYDMKEDQFDNGRRSFINEFKNYINEEEESLNLINRIIHGK